MPILLVLAATDARDDPRQVAAPLIARGPGNMATMNATELWQRGQQGWPRRFPVVQLPNPPLIAAGAGLGVASVAEGTARDLGRGAFDIGLAVWAVEEIVGGANWFRRLMGAGALVWLGTQLAGKL
ncbi:MAG: hypothetical protein M3065_03980 [Actinomycetota bacterium]|nr:hypothetical protein [Actinomycetota bacterium]